MSSFENIYGSPFSQVAAVINVKVKQDYPSTPADQIGVVFKQAVYEMTVR
jgi:hypothetical protein